MVMDSYDAMLEKGKTVEELTKNNIIRVHPDFRVIALGVPVPPYPGHTLDPPLRSRFQARCIEHEDSEQVLDWMHRIAPMASSKVKNKIAVVAKTLENLERQNYFKNQEFMLFPSMMATQHCAALMQVYPENQLAKVLERSFPTCVHQGNEDMRTHVEKLFKKDENPISNNLQNYIPVQHDSGRAYLPSNPEYVFACGKHKLQNPMEKDFVPIKSHQSILSEMIEVRGIYHI